MPDSLPEPVPKTWITFDYHYAGRDGSVTAVSFAQALDRSKVAYLRQCNIGVQSRNFRAEKAKLQDAAIKIQLSDQSFQRFLVLYRRFRDGELTTPHDKAELAQFQSIIKSKEVHNELHFVRRPVA